MLVDPIFIQIHIDQLAYDTDEYIGELYRMNLSCSGGGLPESGCLFFKVAGSANVTNGRIGSFNFSITCHVSDLSSLLQQSSTVLCQAHLLTLTYITTDTVPTPITSVLFSTPKLNVELEPSNVMIPIVIPSVLMGGVVTLTISITIVCIAIRFQNRRERQLQTGSSVTSTVQPQNEGILYNDYSSCIDQIIIGLRLMSCDKSACNVCIILHIRSFNPQMLPRHHNPAYVKKIQPTCAFTWLP